MFTQFAASSKKASRDIRVDTPIVRVEALRIPPSQLALGQTAAAGKGGGHIETLQLPCVDLGSTASAGPRTLGIDGKVSEPMLVGIVSDTHGHLERTRRAVDIFDQRHVDRVIHCGDIGSLEVVQLFVGTPTHFVFGNVDNDHERLKAGIRALDLEWAGEFGSVDWEGCKIAFLHGHDSQRLRQTITEGQYDLVCHGHTHVRRLEQIGSTLVLNPGAVYRANPPSIAVVRLPELEIEHITLYAATAD